MNSIKRLLFVILLSTGSCCYAQDCGNGISKHKLRVGIGDMMFETVRWHNQAHKDNSSIADGISKQEDVYFFYTPHLSVEYSYSILDWLDVGLVCDGQYTSWNRECYNNKDILTGTSRENFYNLSFLLNVRFNYLRREHFGMYSSIAPGIDINGGSETDCFGKHTLAGPSIDLRLIGLTAGSGRYWGFVEFGLMAALKNPDTIFLFGSQLIKVGFTYKFKQ